VYKLRKILYGHGLKHVPRASDKRIDKFVCDIGFTRCITRHDVYVRKAIDKR